MIERSSITGLVLAGGRGSRMGGVDKGLEPHAGQPLAAHALQRLAPQVGRVIVNANRNLDRYRALGVEVVSDALPDYPGPLAGLLAGLRACTTPYLASVPCDTPNFPADLVERLAAALHAEQADVAMAVTRDADGNEQRQPVFCLLRAALADDLADWLQQGQRKIDRWTARHATVHVPFDDAEAFFNANTPAELDQLARR